MRRKLRTAWLAAMIVFPAVSALQAGGGGGKPGSGSGGNTPQKTSGAPLNLQWQEQGPNNFGSFGRGISFDGSGNVFAGSLGGGLFKTTNLGSTWVPVAGLNDNLAVSTLAIDGSTIYVGTGERFFHIPAIPIATSYDTAKADTEKRTCALMHPRTGEGVYVSTDAGATWNHNNATWGPSSAPYVGPFSSIQKVAAKNGKVFVASYQGLFYSTDNLVTKTKSNGTPEFVNTPILDVEFANNNRIFACTADSIYISDDGGQNFGSGINNATAFPRDVPTYPKMGENRMAIAVSPTNPDYVYVTGAGPNNGCSGIWKSTDNGDTWARIAPGEVLGAAFAPFNFQGKYNLMLEVSPSDPDHYYIGGNRMYVYTDTTGLIQAHSTFPILGFPWNYVPSSQNGMAFNPANPRQFFILTDKEIVRTDDAGTTYTKMTKGFNAGHALSVHASPDYKIISGETKTGLIYKSNSDYTIEQQQFYKVYSIPGRVAFSLLDYNHLISQGSDLGLVRSISNGDVWEQFYGVPNDSINPSLGADSIFVNKIDSAGATGNLYDGSGPPLTPWCFDEVINPADLGEDTLIKKTPGYVFMCSHHFVWLVTNPFGGVDSLPKWSRITNNLVPKGATLPKEFLTAITVSGDTNHTVYVATNYGRVYRIIHALDPAGMLADSFVTVISDSTLPVRWISDIEVDANNRNNLLITYGAYDSSGTSRVYITNNANDSVVTWKSIGTNLPKMPVYTAAFNPDPARKAILVGTEEGIYSTTDDWETMTNLTWNAENNNLGNAPVNDIFIRPWYKDDKGNGRFGYAPDFTIYAATNGRGIFQSTNLVSRDKDHPGLTDNSFVDVKLYPNPSKGAAHLEYTFSDRSHLRAEMYDFNGRLVSVITDQDYNEGVFTLDFSTPELVSGIYFIRSEVKNHRGEFSNTLKAVVLK